MFLSFVATEVVLFVILKSPSLKVKPYKDFADSIKKRPSVFNSSGQGKGGGVERGLGR